MILSVLLALLQTTTPLGAPAISSSVNSVATVVEREYFDPDVGAKAAAALKQSLNEGKYTGTPTPAALAVALTRDLHEVTRDKHLAVVVNPPTPTLLAPATPSAITPDEARANDVRRSNAGIRKIEILPGNVGLLDMSFFYRPEEATTAIADAMHILRNADALMIDMRMNGGGSPPTIALLISYFLAEPETLLFDIVHRAPEPTDHYRTASASLSDRNSKRPIYVLTSSRTFSGGEGLAFLLQERHRAEIIGETTAGAANAGRPYPVNEAFNVTVPNGQLKSA